VAEKERQHQILLSYGRRDASDLARRLKTSLEELDYAVWQDVEAIRAGTDFLEKIAAAVKECDAVVAVLSPHSVRRAGDPRNPDNLDSVCLDELSYARFGRPPKPIVPVMAVTCEPPLAIYRLDYIDMTTEAAFADGMRRLREALKEALVGKVPYRAWDSSLRPVEFGAFLEERRRNFVGRSWLFRAIESWLNGKPGEPALIVFGDPGIGKSAIVAELVHRNDQNRVLAYHCCQADAVETLRPGTFVRNIAAMVAGRLRAYADHLTDGGLLDLLDVRAADRDPGYAFDQAVLAPLLNIPEPQGTPRYILIDALDEALTLRDGARAGTIVDLLSSRVDRLPAWLRIVATSRGEPAVLSRLRALRFNKIDAQNPDNVADIAGMVRERLSEPGLKAKLAVGDTTAAKVIKLLSESGNFLYAVEALKGLERDLFGFKELKKLPPGMAAIYERWFQRSFNPDVPEGKELLDDTRRLLQVVVAAQRALTEAELARATGLDAELEIPRLLRKLAPYLPPRPDADGQLRYAPFHKTFVEWLTHDELRGTDYYVSAKSGHRALADVCWAEYQAEPEEMSDYSTAYLATHLILSGQGARAYQLLTDLQFLVRRVGLNGPYRLVEDLRALEEGGLDLKPGSARVVRLLHSALRLASPALAADPSQFASQLRGRLLAYDDPEVVKLLERAKALQPVPGLEPVTASVTPAGSPLLRILRGRLDMVDAVSVAAATHRAVIGDEAGNIVIWDLDSGEVVRQFQVQDDTFACSAPHPTEPLVALGGWEGSLTLVNALDADVVGEVKTELGGVNGVAISPDGRTLCSVHEAVALWTLPDLKESRVFDAPSKERPQAVSFTADGEALLIGSDAVYLCALDGAVKRTYSTGGKKVDSVAVSPDGSVIAAGVTGGEILLSPADGSPARTLAGHPMEFYTAVVSAIKFNGNDRLVSGGWDGKLKVWDTPTRSETLTLTAPSKIYALDTYDGGRRAVTALKMSSVRTWDLASHVEPPAVHGHADKVTGLVRVSDDLVATSGMDGFAILWELRSGRRRVAMKAAAPLSGVGSNGAALFALGNTRVYRMALDAIADPGEEVELPVAHDLLPRPEEHESLILSPTGENVLTGRWTKLQVWGPRKWDKPQAISLGGCAYETIRFSPDGQLAAVDVAGENVLVVGIKSKKPRSKIPLTAEANGLTAVAIDGANERIALGYEDGSVEVRRVDGGEVVCSLRGHSEFVTAMAFADGGASFCSAAHDGSLIVWDIAKERRLYSYYGDASWSVCALYGDTGFIVAGDETGGVHFLRIVEGPK
jgi:WD40 repeat protein